MTSNHIRPVAESLAGTSSRDHKEAEGFCGDHPADRMASGSVAESKHGTCHGCFYPVPLTGLEDNLCGECRGAERQWKPFSEAPSRGDYI